MGKIVYSDWVMIIIAVKAAKRTTKQRECDTRREGESNRTRRLARQMTNNRREKEKKLVVLGYEANNLSLLPGQQQEAITHRYRCSLVLYRQ